MQMYPSQFPPKRRRKATRRAELRIFNALASSNLAGFSYYEWRKDFDDIELDFAVWMRDHGRAALQVKGGGYELRQGEFYLHTQGRVEPIASSPIDEAWLAALDLHDDIVDKLAPAYDPFVLPVLCFPDMQPDEQIEKLAHRKRVCLLWQCDQPDQRLQEILLAQPVRSTLPTSRISREVFGVTDGLINLDMMDNAETSDISCLTSPDSSAQLDPATPATKRLLVSLGNLALIEARAGIIKVHTKVRR